MNKFAIYSPTQGQREDYPVILLSNAVTSENSNAQEWDGEIRTAKLRKPDLLRGVYEITDVTGADITLSGDYSSIFTSGTAIAVYNAAGEYDTYTVLSSTTGDTVITATETITVADATYVYTSSGVTSNDPASDDFRKVPTPDGNEIIRLERFVLTDQTERLVAFTSDNIYYWRTDTTNWSSLNPSGGLTAGTTYWDADIYGNYLVATNGVDRPIQWDGGSATVFTIMDTQLSSTTTDYILTAKYVTSFRQYIFFGYVTYNLGAVVYPEYVVWSNVGEGVLAGGFRQDAGKDAGTAFIAGAGDITGGFGHWQDYLCVFKRYSQRRVWYTGGSIPFNQGVLNPGVGCEAPGSVVNDRDGNLFYYGTDKSFREVSYGSVSKPLIKTARDLNPSLLGLIRSTYVYEYDELQWAVPYGSNSTANNKILTLKAGKWEERDIPVVTFGSYKRQTNYAWDTLPFSTWNTWGWDSWDSVEGSVDFPIDLCTDADGNVYELHGAYSDDGSSYESYFVITTDCTGKKALAHYKRILQMYFYFRSNGSGSEEFVTISIKRDTEANWQSLGTVSLAGAESIIRQRLATDVRARHFELKISATNKYNFVGVEFEFLPVGDR